MMTQRPDGGRVLIYSHDSYGLGHLSRCRTIAHALVAGYKKASVIILSGSPVAGSFTFRNRVAVRLVAGVTKLPNSDYAPLDRETDIAGTLALRAAAIRETVETFRPQLFIVDKEPTGLRGEVLEALAIAKAQGTRLVLGLRDVMDDPGRLLVEWQRKHSLDALRDLYDDIWIYGLAQVYEPLQGLALPPQVPGKVAYTGYLRRETPAHGAPPRLHGITDQPYLLVTTGGGDDGADLVDWVLGAYESDTALPHAALVVLGPFMPADRRAEFLQRASRLGRVAAIDFHPGLETLIDRAAGVVAMGGYNTFCEVLSLDKRALIVPRTEPRLEQHIRASRAAALGLVSMLEDDGRRDAASMAAALRRLPGQRLPSEAAIPGLLDGLDNVVRLAEPWMAAAPVDYKRITRAT